MNACAVHTVQCEVVVVAFQLSRVATRGSDLSTRITTYQTMFNVSCTLATSWLYALAVAGPAAQLPSTGGLLSGAVALTARCTWEEAG